MRTIVASLALMAATAAVVGQTAATDWKYYGSAEARQMGEGFGKIPATYIFFDAKGIRQMPDHHLNLWAKSLPKAEVDALTSAIATDPALGAAFTERIQSKYIPPFAAATGASPEKDKKGYISFVFWEAVANTKNMQPTSRILYDIDCAQRRIRSLSLQLYTDKTPPEGLSSNEAGDWDYAAPDTNAGYLMAIVCPSR
jgi:hypothetical protein